MSDRTVHPSEFKERVRINRLRPKESDFMGRKGYERYHEAEVGGERIKVKGEAPDGSYLWRFKFKPNEGGKLTREAAEVGARLKPFTEADTARQLNRPAADRVMLRDKDGGVRHIDPALADDTARSRGWSHAWRVGGCRVERGVDGELWRELPDGTREPTGRWCLTTPQPWAAVPDGGNADGSMKA